jgi:hypothetical protein
MSKYTFVGLFLIKVIYHTSKSKETKKAYNSEFKLQQSSLRMLRIANKASLTREEFPFSVTETIMSGSDYLSQ